MSDITGSFAVNRIFLFAANTCVSLIYAEGMPTRRLEACYIAYYKPLRLPVAGICDMQVTSVLRRDISSAAIY